MIQKHVLKVAIADDHAMTRRGIKAYLESSGDIMVIMEADNGQQMLDIMAAANQLPDVCIIDVSMPVLDGLGLLRGIKTRWKAIRCLALTAYDAHPLVFRMIKEGINGYLLKSSDPDELTRAVRIVQSSGFYYSDIADYDTFRKVHNKRIPVLSLSPVEIELLQYVCSEMSYQAIADKMGLSFYRVDALRKKLFTRLNVTTRTGLGFAAVREGIVPANVFPDQIKNIAK